MDDVDQADDGEGGADPRGSNRRSIGVAVGVAFGVALSTVAVAFSVIAIPLYALASFDGNGLDRPMIRDGLFKVALPLGIVVGLAVGAVVGAWYARGGRLPTDRTPFHE